MTEKDIAVAAPPSVNPCTKRHPRIDRKTLNTTSDVVALRVIKRTRKGEGRVLRPKQIGEHPRSIGDPRKERGGGRGRLRPHRGGAGGGAGVTLLTVADRDTAGRPTGTTDTRGVGRHGGVITAPREFINRLEYPTLISKVPSFGFPIR